MAHAQPLAVKAGGHEPAARSTPDRAALSFDWHHRLSDDNTEPRWIARLISEHLHRALYGACHAAHPLLIPMNANPITRPSLSALLASVAVLDEPGDSPVDDAACDIGKGQGRQDGDRVCMVMRLIGARRQVDPMAAYISCSLHRRLPAERPEWRRQQPVAIMEMMTSGAYLSR